MKMLTVLAAAALAAGCSTFANADAALGPRSASVRFGDLDLESAPGVVVLFHRLRNAANIVCRDLEPGRSLAFIYPHELCVGKALKGAIATINRPALTRYAAVRGIVLDNPPQIARNP